MQEQETDPHGWSRVRERERGTEGQRGRGREGREGADRAGPSGLWQGFCPEEVGAMEGSRQRKNMA